MVTDSRIQPRTLAGTFEPPQSFWILRLLLQTQRHCVLLGGSVGRHPRGRGATSHTFGCLPVSAMVHIPSAQDVLRPDGSLANLDDAEQWESYVDRCFCAIDLVGTTKPPNSIVVLLIRWWRHQVWYRIRLNETLLRLPLVQKTRSRLFSEWMSTNNVCK